MADYKISARIDLDQAQKDWDKLVSMANAAAPKITAALKPSGEVSKQTKSTKETTKSFADLTGQANKLMQEMQRLTRARKLDNVAVAKAQRESKELTSALRKASHETIGYKHDMDKLAASTSKFNNVTRKAQEATAGWWKRFGAVAVGFGVAYRAINVLENGVAAYVEILREGLTAQDEFIELQAKLAMYSQLYASNAKSFAEGFQLAAVNVAAFRKELPMAISSVGELTQGIDEFIQHGYAIGPMTAHGMVNFLDFTAMIAVAVGSTSKQIRQEIQSLFEGTQRAGNQMLRLLKSLIPNFDAFLERLRGVDTKGAMAELFEKISEPMDELKELMILMSATKAHIKWRKQLVLDVQAAAELAASMEGLAKGTNIFAAVFAKHASTMSDAAKKDLAEAFVGLAHAFDSLLDKAPAMLVMLTKLTWGLALLSEQTLKYGAVILYSSAIFMFAKSLKMLGTAIMLLPIARLAKLGKALQSFGRVGLAGALGAGTVVHIADLMTKKFELCADAGIDLDNVLLKLQADLKAKEEFGAVSSIQIMIDKGYEAAEILGFIAAKWDKASVGGEAFWKTVEKLNITIDETTVLGQALKKMFSGVTDELAPTEDITKELEEFLEVWNENLGKVAKQTEALKMLKSVTLSFYKDMQAAAKAGDIEGVLELRKAAANELAESLRLVNEKIKILQEAFNTDPKNVGLALAIEQLRRDAKELDEQLAATIKNVPLFVAQINDLHKSFVERISEIKLRAAATGQDLSAELQAICTDFFVQLQTITAATGELVNLPEIKAALEKMRKAYTTTANSIKTDFDSILKNIEGFEFEETAFGNELADSINNAMISMHDLNEVFTEHARIQADINELVIERERIEAQAALDARNYDYIQMQISGYRQLSGTISQLFKEDSKEREIMHKAEMAFAVIELAMITKKIAMDAIATVAAVTNSATRCNAKAAEATTSAVAGIANQATGDPYTAFARIAAMIVLMGSVLAMGGIAFGGGSKDSSSSAKSNPLTTGTVLGDPTKSSESLQNSLNLMEEYHAEDYKELVGIHNEMKDLNDNITGLISNIVRGFDEFGGEKFESTAKGFFGKQSDEMIKTFERITDALTLPLDFAGKMLGAFTSGVTDIAGKVGDWVFGGKVKIKVTSAGIALGYDEKGKPQPTAVGDILAGDYPSVQAYYNIYKKTSGGLFGSTKRKRWTEFEDVDADITRLFDKIYENMANMLVALAEGFNFSAEQMAEVFAYEFAAAKLDLKGLTGAEITEKINIWLSTMGDKAAETLFGEFIAKYQEVDEGILETAMRLLAQKEILFAVFELTNIAFDDTTTAAIDFSQAIIALATDFESLIEAIGQYYDAFFSEQEKFEDTIISLGKTLTDIGYVLPFTREGFRDLVESLDLTTEAGKEAYVTLMQSAEAFDTFYDYLEEHLQDMSGEEFAVAFEELIRVMKEAGATTEELAETLINAENLILESIEDIKKRHEDYGKTALELFYEKHPEWEGTTYDQWAGTNLTNWSVEMLQEWRNFGELLEAQWEEQQGILEDIADTTTKAYEDERKEIERLIEAFTKATEAITDYQEELLSGADILSPDIQYAQASQQLTAAVQGLYSKDRDIALAAIQDIPDYAGGFLEASKAFAATPEQYMADFARVMAILNTAQDIEAEWIRKLGRLLSGLAESMRPDAGDTYAFSQWGTPGTYPGGWVGGSPGAYNMQLGGALSGPESGYAAPITFHGAEHIVPGDQMKEVKEVLGEVKVILMQVLDTNGDQNKVNKKLYRIIDRVSQGEEYLMTKAV